MPAIDKNKIEAELNQWFTISEGAVEIDDNGIISVTGDSSKVKVSLKKDHPQGTRIPLRFGTVSGEFNLGHSERDKDGKVTVPQRLTSVAGCPRHVGKLIIDGIQGIDLGDLSGVTVTIETQITRCGLTSLAGVPPAPCIDVNNNESLTSLQGLAGGTKVKWIKADSCSLASLEGTPSTVRRIGINNSHVPIQSLRGLPHRLQILEADSNIPCCMLLETEWMNGPTPDPSPRFGKHIILQGDKQLISDIRAAFEEFYPLRHDGIPGFAFKLIKMGHRQNAHF